MRGSTSARRMDTSTSSRLIRRRDEPRIRTRHPGGLRAALRRPAAAEAIVATDPLVSSSVMRPQLAEWQLVGIDLGAVDDNLT
jgi:hypothetical protein